MSGYFIGIDSGGTMTKVALFDLAGRELAVEASPSEMTIAKPGWTERDPNAMWRSACTSLRNLLARNAISADRILAVTPTGYGGGGYWVDEQGRATRNGIVSTDSRVTEMHARWAREGIADQLSQFNQQSVWGGQSLSLIAWLEENEPEVAARSRYFLSCKDFLRLRLCGDISTDATDAGCGGLIDVASGTYATGALNLLGLAHWLDKLPPIGPAAEVVGTVTPAVALETGLRTGTPVVRGVYDVVGCALATGFVSVRQVAAVAGTFAIHSTLHETPCMDPIPTIQTPYPVGGLAIATMATPTSASNLEWVRNTLLRHEADLAEADGRSIYDLCNELVANTLNRGNDLQFLPFIFGGAGGVPAGILGVTANTCMADILRAVYEGVVFAHRSDMDTLLGGSQSAQADVVRLAGGAARSDVWVQMFADGLGMPVELTEGNELGAKGAAICASVAVGTYADFEEAIANMVQPGRRFIPNPARADQLTRKYTAFRQVAEMYKKFNQLTDANAQRNDQKKAGSHAHA